MTLQQSGGVTNNRIATVNGITYGYDAAGDVTNDGLYAYAFDAECRIVSVDSGSTGTYSYDAANRRVKKVAGGYTTYYVWEGSNVIAEYGNAPASGGGTRFYHPDRLSNRMITDASGVVKGSMDNLPFGEDGGVAGESEKHRFTSYERDGETGSDYAMNRQHSSSTGRFMRPDPVRGSISNPQSLNRYAYTANDPINLTDPTGLTLSIPGFCSAQFSSCGGGGDGGSGFSGTPFDDTAFGGGGGGGGMPASVAEGLAAYLGRLQNTYDAMAATYALKHGHPEIAAALMAANPTLISVASLSQEQTNALALISLLFGQAIGDQVRFDVVANLTGLSGYINDYTYNAADRTFDINFKSGVNDFLANSPYFGGPGIAFLHREVGIWDYRSYTDMTGGQSMQVVLGNDLRKSYADFDRYNPYQDVYSFFRHNLPILFGRIFR